MAGLSIADLIPSLGAWVAKNRQAAQQPMLDAGLARAEGLMGQAGTSFEDFGQNGMEFDQAQEASGLMADPTDFANQLKFGLGLMTAPGFSGLGQGIASQAFQQQLGLPMELQRLAEQRRQHDATQAQGTTLEQNLQAAGIQPGTPEYSQAIMAYLAKNPTTNIQLPGQAQLGAQGTAGAIQGVNAQLEQPDMAAYVPSLGDQSLDMLPAGTGNYFQSDEYKRFKSLSGVWIEQTLRDESGAAIAQSEYDSKRKIYFPVPGDGPKEVAQKKQLRLQATQSRLQKAGAGDPTGVQQVEAYDPAAGQPPKPGKIYELPPNVIDVPDPETPTTNSRRRRYKGN